MDAHPPIPPERSRAGTASDDQDTIDPVAEATGGASTTSRSSASPGARLAPGDTIGGRFRIVTLLGRGGMGEVYRAEDLRLGQQVALKFLPAGLAADPARVDRLVGEVRSARQVSHPNVCRVFDIGEADGRQFIAMEYVDGEDLASLLRRIGRVPPEKAVQIGQQICAGLAAVHEVGVVHRDLKPGNIMIDGRGRVRITDFGVAAASDDTSAGWVGTLAYMAPEQLRREPATMRSDVYALGVVLHELFTGERPYGATSIDELLQSQTDATHDSMTSRFGDIDPAIDRVVRRCLAPEACERPASALSVAAALPGGNPLQAALAAGETPSPELIAASGGRGALPPRRAAAMAGGIVILSVGAMLVGSRISLLAATGVPKARAVLIERAEEVVRALGHGETPVNDRASWWTLSRSQFEWVAANNRSDRWLLFAERPPTLPLFKYRQSPVPLRALAADGRIDWDDPPFHEAGEIRLTLDAKGRLVDFAARPPLVVPEDGGEAPASDSAPKPGSERDATALARAFQLAEIDPARFAPAALERLAGTDSLRRQAWERTGPVEGELAKDERIEVFAGSRGDAIDFFEVRFPFQPARGGFASTTTRSGTMVQNVVNGFVVLVVLAGSVLAYRNFRLRRADVRGATRLVVFVMLLRAVSTLLQAPSLAALPGMVFATHSAVAASFVSSVLIWVVYLALEPLARRVWPGSLVGWSRVLAGRWKDPMVGRDCLVGMLAAAVMLPSALLVFLLLRSRGALGPGVTVAGVLDALMGARFMLAAVLDALGNGIESALIIALLVVLVGAVVRVQWLAAVLVSLVLVLPQLATPLGGSVQALVNLLVLLASIVMMVRLGVLAGVVTLACAQVLGMLGLVLDPDAWYRTAALVPAAAIAIAVVYAYRVSTGGQSLVLPEAQAPRTA
ncbi:MAG: serine/threonine protein kinase [Phycisphaerales bacterium]|nr:serine/threonine protein kinase [Phycisphaerales bacterium]